MQFWLNCRWEVSVVSRKVPWMEVCNTLLVLFVALSFWPLHFAPGSFTSSEAHFCNAFAVFSFHSKIAETGRSRKTKSMKETWFFRLARQNLWIFHGSWQGAWGVEYVVFFMFPQEKYGKDDGRCGLNIGILLSSSQAFWYVDRLWKKVFAKKILETWDDMCKDVSIRPFLQRRSALHHNPLM